MSGALKGIALGFATPFCTYSAIPVLVAMLDTGVRTATWVGFLLAAPVLDPLIAVAIAVIFSPQAALAYSAVTFAAVFLAAIVADAAGLDHLVARTRVTAPAPVDGDGGVVAVEPRIAAGTPPAAPLANTAAGCDPTAAACDGAATTDPLSDTTPWRGWVPEARRAVRYAVGLIRGMAVPLVIAVAFAAAIIGFVPQGLLASLAGPGNPLAVPAAAVIGTPFYVSGEAFLPIAAALLDAGAGQGAVFALIIAGAGVNIPELTLLARLLHPRGLVALVATIFVVATTAGYLIPVLIL